MRYVVSLFMVIAPSVALPAEQWRVNPAVLSCSPEVLKEGQVLTLSLGPNHGKELSIQGPNKDQDFLLVVGSPPADDPQLMSTEAFSRAKVVRIPSQQLGRPWVIGAQVQKVFSAPGIYTISVSENLESEQGGYFCKIRYAG